MSVDPSVISAMRLAVEADAENTGLRLHLAQLLMSAGKALDALECCRYVLAKQPDHLEALSLGARAAEGAGDASASTGYRKLYEALSWQQTKGLIDNLGDKPLPGDDARGGRSRKFDVPPESSDSRSDVPVPIAGDSDQFPESESFNEWETERVTTMLKDVAGMEEVKRRLNLAFLGPLKNPDMMKLYGKSLRGGLLLYGPPGCGKTFVARATAGELGAKFISIGLSDVLDMWMGESERKLHEVFEHARRNKPCVLFFDEIDAIGRKRSLIRNSSSANLVNQLLSEMDNVDGNNEGVFVLAATNHPWDVDSALRRPGRLDRTLLVLPPDISARKALVQKGTENRPTQGIDAVWLSANTEGYSGADIAHLCDSAAELALEASLNSGTARPISMTDFKTALREIKPSVRTWFDTAKNYAQFANEGGAYDELVAYLKAQRIL